MVPFGVFSLAEWHGLESEYTEGGTGDGARFCRRPVLPFCWRLYDIESWCVMPRFVKWDVNLEEKYSPPVSVDKHLMLV